jgi:hypothetical protein
LLNTDPDFGTTNESTFRIIVSYLVYRRPYKIIGDPVPFKSDFE